MTIISLGLTLRTLPGLGYCLVPLFAGVWTGASLMLLFMMPSLLKPAHALCIPVFLGACYLIRQRWLAAREATDEAEADGEYGKFSNYAILTFLVIIFFFSFGTGIVMGKMIAESHHAKVEEQQLLEKAQAERKAASNYVAEATPPAAEAPVATVSGQPPARAIAAALPLLKLKSIIGSAQKRTALINSTPLSIGETSVLKIEGKTIKVKCIDITEKSVRLELNDNADHVDLNME